MQLQEYVRKIGACLVQLEQSHDNKAKTMMETLTNESSRLIGCIKLLNHNVHRAMLMGKMDESLSNSHKLGAAFYSNLSVRSLAVCSLTLTKRSEWVSSGSSDVLSRPDTLLSNIWLRCIIFTDYQHMISTLCSLHVELFASPGLFESVCYNTYNAVEPVGSRVLSFAVLALRVCNMLHHTLMRRLQWAVRNYQKSCRLLQLLLYQHLHMK